MASLYKKPVVINDPKTGQRIKTKSKKWWGRFRDEDGKEKRVPLATDKSASQTMLNKLVKKTERIVAGLADPMEDHLKRPLLQHLADYEAYLQAKGNTKTHCRQTAQYARTIAHECRFTRINDISASRVQECIADLRRIGKSIGTCNHYLRAIKGFCRWLVRDRRWADNRLAHRNGDGRFADFHATRHTFISNLTRSGTSPKMAQTLARHSDINLTMGVYTHVEIFDRAAAIASLPAPPSSAKRAKAAS